jgi:hypothetical protein
VSAIVEGLSDLDAAGVPVTADALRDVLGRELSRQLTEVSGVGQGVLVGPLRDFVGADLDLLFVLGAAEGIYPPRGRQDPLLRDDIRIRAGLRTLTDRRHAERRDHLAAIAAAPAVVLTHPAADVARVSRGDADECQVEGGLAAVAAGSARPGLPRRSGPRGSCRTPGNRPWDWPIAVPQPELGQLPRRRDGTQAAIWADRFPSLIIDRDVIDGRPVEDPVADVGAGKKERHLLSVLLRAGQEPPSGDPALPLGQFVAAAFGFLPAEITGMTKRVDAVGGKRCHVRSFSRSDSCRNLPSVTTTDWPSLFTAHTCDAAAW